MNFYVKTLLLFRTRVFNLQNREAERENGKLRSRLKDLDVLEDDNQKLMFHIQELESIVDKVICQLKPLLLMPDKKI